MDLALSHYEIATNQRTLDGLDNDCSNPLSAQLTDQDEDFSESLSSRITYLDAFKLRNSLVGTDNTSSLNTEGVYRGAVIRNTRSLAKILQNPIRVFGFILPHDLADIANRVASSHNFLELEENWDGCGGPKYKYSTWMTATGVVVNAAIDYWSVSKKVPTSPAILQGIDGDIDVIWRSGHRSLLINTPEEESLRPSFVGKDSRDSEIEINGTLTVREGNGWLLQWLNY